MSMYKLKSTPAHSSVGYMKLVSKHEAHAKNDRWLKVTIVKVTWLRTDFFENNHNFNIVL